MAAESATSESSSSSLAPDLAGYRSFKLVSCSQADPWPAVAAAPNHLCSTASAPCTRTHDLLLCAP